ncbi:hypothetical protein V9T40_006426 [Parthenolecanium corni]|uniref:Uncharacterized protein n=1 Tax=Parthenolecanium corni TaxID=536013 RepID=A0AAN9Y7M6_9HEMI
MSGNGVDNPIPPADGQIGDRQEPLVDPEGNPIPPSTKPHIQFRDGNILEFPPEGASVAGTSGTGDTRNPHDSPENSSEESSPSDSRTQHGENDDNNDGQERIIPSLTKTQLEQDTIELENQKAIAELLLEEQTKRIKEITANLRKHTDLAASIELSVEHLKKIARESGLDPEDLPGSLARQMRRTSIQSVQPLVEAPVADPATQTSTPLTTRNQNQDQPERRQTVRFSENFTAIAPVSNASSVGEANNSPSQNTGSPIIAGNQATPGSSSQQPIISNQTSIPMSQPVFTTSAQQLPTSSMPVAAPHQQSLFSAPPPVIPSAVTQPQSPAESQPEPYQPYGTTRSQGTSFHPVLEPDPNQPVGQGPNQGIAMKINMRWKPDVTAAPVMAPLEFERTTAVSPGGGGNDGQHPANIPSSIVIPPSAVTGTGQPIHLYLHQPSSNYTSRYFDPTKLQPYKGKADTRSPISFIREFEHCTSGISDNIVRGKLFIRAFDRDHFQTAKSYRFDAGFVHLKDQFLKTEWNDNCKQQILLEIENAVYDPRRYDSIADFIIDIYSKMFDCQLPILSIHSKVMRKAPVYYSGQLKPKHCATFETFSEKVRSLHATYGAFDATMQLPPVNPYAVKPPVHRAVANTSSRNQEAIFFVDQTNPDPESESEAEQSRNEELSGNDY